MVARFAGMWYHLSLFLNAGELGVAYTGVTTATALSQVLGGPLAAALLLLNGTLGFHGWQWLFLLEGIPTMAFGVFLKVSFPDLLLAWLVCAAFKQAVWMVQVYLAPSPATARCLDPAERAWLQSRQDKAASSKKAAASQLSAKGAIFGPAKFQCQPYKAMRSLLLLD